MKKILQPILGLFVCAFMLVPFAGVKATNEISDYEGLKAAFENGGEYTLTEDIVINEPLTSGKDVTIYGNDHVIKPIDDANTVWPGPNKTLVTSELTGTITLNGVFLEGSPKYGVQAYNGGHVVLNGVVIRNSGFGAVSINGGTVTINHLVMENNTYGIEFGIGSGVTGVPTLVMDGVLEGKDQVDPITVDTTQITADKTITVENTLGTSQTIDLVDNKVTIKNTDGTVAFESNELLDGTEVTVNNEQPASEEPSVNDDKKDEVKDEEENPKTSDGIVLVIGALTVSILVALVAKKKLA